MAIADSYDVDDAVGTVLGVHPGILAAVAAVGERLHALVRRRLDDGGPAADPFRGMHIEASDAQRLIARPPLAPANEPAGPSFVLPSAALASPLGAAVRGLELAPFEALVVVLCLLPELDARYGTLIGFLHDDVTRKHPSVELALALYGPDPPSLAGLHVFLPEAPLRAWDLVRLSGDDALIRQTLALDRAFLWYLLGARALDAGVEGIARVSREEHGAETAPPGLMGLLGGAASGTALLLYGEDTNACVGAAAEAGRAFGRPLLLIDGAKIAALDAEQGAATLRRCLREAVLRDLLPCVTGAATLLREHTPSAQGCRGAIAASPIPALLVSESAASELAYAGSGIVPVHVPPPRADARLGVWSAAARAHGITIDEATLLALAETTSGLSASAVEDVVALATAGAAADGARATGQHVQRAARGTLRARVKTLNLLAPRYGWDDIILPPDRLQLLRHLCSRVRYRAQVRETWGVGGATLPGVTALFAGQPGTGKSMAAEIVANDLGLDLYKIDLAQIVSKYIGETEKNLSRLFDEAEASGVVLVFDEADALFGKRSDVKDSHDRYANLEISYLLQRMERYRGLAVLTTNLRANLDEAFTRRIGVSIDFPLPGAADRLRMWRRALDKAPCAPDLELGALAQGLELAGGAILNVAVAAAHLAAEEGAAIDHERLLRAVRWELQKMGRLMDGATLDALMPVTSGAGRNGKLVR